MHRSRFNRLPAWLLLSMLGIAGFAFSERMPAAGADAFTLTSPAFVNGGTLPAKYTCDGERASPPLAWSNPPAGTRFFAVTMHHIPEPGVKHVYLVVYNIPATVSSLPENAKDIGVFGINTVNRRQEYTPPCSKGPGPKKYTLTAYALSAPAKIDGPASAVTMDMLLAAIQDKILAKAILNVTYSRPDGAVAEAGGGQAGAPPENGAGGGASGGGPGGPRLPRELQSALESLDLSGAQKQKVDADLSAYQEQQRQLRDALLQKLQGDLSADQYAKIAKAFQKPPRTPPDSPSGPPNEPAP
jgi:phosphatidylethanolamine-binding protein (PEBP) family uncharacterized protein